MNGRWPSRRALFCGLMGALGGLGCDAEVTNDYTCGAKQEADAGIMGDGGGPEPAKDAGPMCVVAAVADCAGGAVPDMCNTKPGPGLGSISGTVVVNAGVMPGATYPAKGDLYLIASSEFDVSSCPGDKGAALPTAFAVIHCADLTKGAAVPFTIEGVPVRDKPWFIVPVLDVQSKPGPMSLDSCDLLSLPTQVVVDAAKEVKLSTPIGLALSGSLLISSCGLASCK